MEPMKLYFDVRDIFRAPRLALSGKKIWIFLVANLIGYVCYFILNYIALALSGVSFGQTWSTQGLYPCLYPVGGPWYAWLIFWGGVLDWFFAIHLACTAVSRVTYKQLKGDEFYSSADAWKYIKKHWHPVIFTSVSMVLILFFFIAMAAIFALLGMIPYLGDFLFVLPYIFYLFGAIFTVYTAAVFLISFIYTPAIVGTIEEDTMGAVFNSYSITWSQPWRIIIYHAILLPISIFSLAVFKFTTFSGMKLLDAVFGNEILMGQKLANIVGTAGQTVWPENLFSSVVNNWYNLNDFYTYYTPPVPASLSGTECVGAYIVGLFLFLITLTFLSYFLSILSVGETLMFTIFRNNSDEDNILQRKDEEELEAEEDTDSNEDFSSEEELTVESESPDSDANDETLGSG